MNGQRMHLIASFPVESEQTSVEGTFLCNGHHQSSIYLSTAKEAQDWKTTCLATVYPQPHFQPTYVLNAQGSVAKGGRHLSTV